MDNLSGELLGAAAAVIGGVGAGGFVRAYIRHRTRLHLERERSARAAARAKGLIGLAGRHDSVMIDEEDSDGHRIVRLRSRRQDPRGERNDAERDAA